MPLSQKALEYSPKESDIRKFIEIATNLDKHEQLINLIWLAEQLNKFQDMVLTSVSLMDLDEGFPDISNN
jgi:hypothetical protein